MVDQSNMKMVVGTTRYAFPKVRIIKFDDFPNEITSISPALFYHAWHTCFFPQNLVLHHLLIVVFTQNPPCLTRDDKKSVDFLGLVLVSNMRAGKFTSSNMRAGKFPDVIFCDISATFLENIGVEYKKLHRAYCVGFKNNVFFLPIQYSHVSNQEYTKTQMFK